MSRIVRASAAAFVFFAAVVFVAVFASEPDRGAVIQNLATGAEGERAGLKEGDVILAWSRGAEKGDVSSSFDIHEVGLEAARGGVTLTGVRGSEARQWHLGPGSWGIVARPVLHGAVLAAFLEGEQLIKGGNPEGGVARWRTGVTSSQGTPAVGLGWLSYRIASELAAARRWQEADEAYATAVAQTSEVSGTAAAQILRAWGGTFGVRGEPDLARARYLQAVELRRRVSPDSLALAASCVDVAALASSRGQFDEAEQFYREALSIRERLVPASTEVSNALNGLGTLALRRGNLAEAARLYDQALGLRQKSEAGTVGIAILLNNLGLVAEQRGDLDAAEDFYRRALAINQKLAPGSSTLANNLANLGIVSSRRGDLAAADALTRQALAIYEKPGMDGLALATVLNSLGTIALGRGDLEDAARFFRRSLELREKLAPDSPAVATSLHNLGNTAIERGDLEDAERHLLRALAVREKRVPGTLPVATTLNSLGSLAHLRGDFQSAIAFTTRSLQIKEKLVPDGLVVATSLNNLGTLLLEQGDLDSAERHYQRALAIVSRIAPGSDLEASVLRGWGSVLHNKGRLDEAMELARRAIEALEAQTTRLGGTEETRAGYRAQNIRAYSNYVAGLVEQNRPREAFHYLERFRARSFLTMLAERDIVFASDLPADVERQRRLNAASTDRVQAQLSGLTPSKDAGRIDELRGKLRELAAERDQIATRIRQESPRVASLQYPQALDAAGAQSVLDRGTILLSYLTGKDESLLFALTSSSVSMLSIPAGEDEIRRKIGEFRALIQQPIRARSSEQRGLRVQARRDGASFMRLAHELYDLLIKPADELIKKSDRVVIVPYGPLHTLPFAALLRNDGHYLIEWKPLHTVMSATVYAELKNTRREGDRVAVQYAAFGDPLYSASSPDSGGDAAKRRFDLRPLPATREEVRSIAALYGDRSRSWLGAEATEERAKAIGKDVRYLHFATHGLLDEQSPLSSALALTPPGDAAEGRDNGLLQAWEIFERVRLDADLVVLSACQTGLGKEMGGEGLVGLTRAFQYAGARSVLASLWSVADTSTADLMTKFYSFLRHGRSKDDALRRAQVALIKSAEYSDPFYWAPFVLTGDWR
jgi:CHAT domain-containing protein/Tfp pilus assembly protein PilF